MIFQIHPQTVTVAQHKLQASTAPRRARRFHAGYFCLDVGGNFYIMGRRAFVATSSINKLNGDIIKKHPIV